MATHSSILTWKIPWTEEPGGLQSMGRKLYMTECLSLSKESKRKKKKISPANSHIFVSEGQLLFDPVLISGEDRIF